MCGHRLEVAAFDLLCALVRPEVDTGFVRQTLGRKVPFGALLQAARDHSLRPQLIRALAGLGWEGVPAAQRSPLENFQQLHGALALGMAEQLGRVSDAMAAHGLRCGAFKGATLAVVLYGSLSAREYTDIDLIVPAEALDDAEDVLEALGYASDHDDRRFRRAFLGYQRQISFGHPAQAAIDLHWDFTGIHLPFPLTPAEIWDSLETIKVGQHDVPAITGANLALLLAGHGTKERWRSLGWVVDFAVLVDRQRGLDWSTIYRHAQAAGCGDNVLLACTLAERLLGVGVPEALIGPLGRRTRVEALVSGMIDELRLGEEGRKKGRNLVDIDLCDRRLDRIAASVKLALTPTISDYRAMPLPSSLWPLYRVTRPFRLAASTLASRLQLRLE